RSPLDPRRLPRLDLEGPQTRCESRWIDTKQLSGAALTIDSTVGSPQRTHQVLTLTIAQFAVRQNDIWRVGHRRLYPRAVRQCNVEAAYRHPRRQRIRKHT